jgi:lipoic acid synthetase
VLRVRRLGLVSYQEAYDLQRALAQRARDDYLLVLEHPHVYTLGVRADPGHVLIEPGKVGAELVKTDRGGDVTYHGPGQLVVYPILTVERDPGAGPRHVSEIQEAVLGALRDVGASAMPPLGLMAEYPGIWVDPQGPRPRKLAAIGVRTVRADDGRRRTLHGVALNVNCDLSMFEHIVPCGITDYGVTSLAAEGVEVSREEMTESLIARFESLWGRGDPADRLAVVTGHTAGAPTSSSVGSGERVLIRRLRQAGQDPEDALALGERKPSWLRAKVDLGANYRHLSHTLRDLDLVTVCEEAGCPNIYECWRDGTATFMINGSRCTRACGFCKVDTRHPLPLDASEPDRVAAAVARLGLAHAVVTCVARDDLDDGGAGALAETIGAIRHHRPGTNVEVLMSDCKGDADAQSVVFDARPDVLNHNIETVPRLQRAVRPSAGYARSLSLLARAANAGLVVKSGLMVGLGETAAEVHSTLADLAGVGVSIATIGQYLRPSRDHLPVARWWEPAEFDELAAAGRALGLTHVEASPLTRSSYHARGAAEAVERLELTRKTAVRAG